jgi:fumarylacetoacetate (FAA) hydrolase
MRLVSYINNRSEALGLLIGDQVYPVNLLQAGWPRTMLELLARWEDWQPRLSGMERRIRQEGGAAYRRMPLSALQLLSPVPRPPCCRDGYSFRQHVETARRNRGLGMIPQFDEYPVFYYNNPLTVRGPGEVPCMPDHFRELDFELEVAIVIGREGRNIPAAEADDYIAGLMVMNDLSARTLQMEEMLLNLGPAKGKDFATALGPWLVTTEELRPYETACPPGHTGLSWDLEMRARVNGFETSRGNVRDMDWTFAEIIERASYGVTLHPGEVIGSGTVGTGCFLELNGTGRVTDPNYVAQWLQPWDQIECTIDGLGTLTNTVVADPSGHSILGLKKKSTMIHSPHNRT